MTTTSTRRFGMYLQLVDSDEEQVLRCRECGEDICEVDDDYEDWRDHVPVRESEIADRMVDDLGMWVHRRDEEDKAVMMEYYCPNCAIRLQAQTTLDTEKRPLQANPEFI